MIGRDQIDMGNTNVWLNRIETKLLLLIVIALSLINSVFIDQIIVSITVSIIETIISTYLLYKSHLDRFVLSVLLFSSTCIESANFTTGTNDAEIISFLNMPVVHHYYLVALVGIAFFKIIPLRVLFKGEINLFSLEENLFVIYIIGIIITIFTLIINDNNILFFPDLYQFIIKDAYNALWCFSIFSLLYYLLCRNLSFALRLKKFILSLLVGLTIAGILLTLLGNFYIRDAGTTYLICPLGFFWSPALILFYYTERHGVWYLLLGLASIGVQVMHTLGIAGTWWIVVSLIGCIFLIRSVICLFKTRCRSKALMICIVLCASIAFGWWISVSDDGLGEINGQAAYKLITFMNLINWDNDLMTWYSMLGDSIGVRVESIINICIEYVHNPIALLTGKGFGGSVIKYWGIYNWNDWGSSFPDAQICHGIYSSFHTGIAEIMINAGLSGIILLLILFNKTVKSILKQSIAQPWLVLGTLWVAFFYSFYYSMCLGIACLSYGLYLANKKRGFSDSENH